MHNILLTSSIFQLPMIATAGVSSGSCMYLCNNLRRLFHNSCVLEHKQKKCSISSGTSFQSEHRGLIVGSNFDVLLFRYTQLFNRLYWKIRKEDLLQKCRCCIIDKYLASWLEIFNSTLLQTPINFYGIIYFQF